MKDRDCESCKKFSRGDPHESEGYCEAKRTWVDPQEGEDCKMHEFTLWTANKYKDGTPIMSTPKVESNQLDELKEGVVELTLRNSFLTKRIDESEQHIDELSEEYDAVLKTHGDTLEEHLDRICNLEHLYEKVLDDLCAMRDRLCKITDLLVMQDEYSHIFSNFCGNCVHAEMEDGLCTCALTGEALDPDYASCSRFDPSFTHMNDRPDWLEKIRKDMTTPSEPTEGCKDCKCAVDGMCVKYNCSLGAICATPECHEPAPF